MIALFGLAFTINTAAAQNCSPVTSQDLDMQIDSVAMGFLEFDWAKIENGLASIESKVPCLTESIDPEVANDYHMLSGLYLYYKSQMEENEEGKSQAENSLRLAKRLAPDKTIPKHIFNDGHEIHEIYAELEYIELESDIPVSSRGVYIFNGQTINRPANTKSIVQIKEGSSILLSAVIQAGEALPMAPSITAPVVITKSEDTNTNKATPAESIESTVAVENPPTLSNTSTANASTERSFPWLWTGGVLLGSAGSLATTYMACGSPVICGGEVSNGNVESQEQLDGLKYGNWGFIGLSALSAYQMQKHLRAGKSSNPESAAK